MRVCYRSALGEIALESSQGALSALRFQCQYDTPAIPPAFSTTLSTTFFPTSSATISPTLLPTPAPSNPAKDPIITQTILWLDMYFSGEIPHFSPPIAFGGSAFARCVLEIVRGIGYGEVRSYGELARQVARQLGIKPCAQAVGGALKRNPIMLIIPCHRIVCANGALGGYAAGASTKRALLQLEST